MKLTAILLTAFCLTASATGGHAQGISFSGRDVPLKTVFAAIEKQAGYVFFYDAELLNGAKAVTVSVKNATVEDLLKQALKNQPLDYTIKGKTVFIVKKEDTKMEGHSGLDPESFSQLPPPIDITGKVTDTDGNPLSGATVKVKGTSKGTTTNNDGVFVLKGVDDNAALEISYVGYETMTTKLSSASGGGLGLITLKVKPESLNEVIVQKGYYTEKIRNTVGNVAHVDYKDIEKQPVQNPLLALQDRVPGLQVTQLTGMPGGGVKVQIQGINTLRYTTPSATSPLVVVDGVPFPAYLQVTTVEGIVQGGSPLDYINPNDIEAIDILKDADATAIYGSRAANGAILITTKKGKSGRTKVDVNLQQGWSTVARRVQMMNTRQYLDMRYEALKNDNIPLSSLDQTSNYDLTVWDTTRYTDWQKELLGGAALYTNINANVSGGNSTIQYLIGGTYIRQTNVFSGDFDDKKGDLHYSITSSNKDQRFRLQFNGDFMYDKNRLPGVDLTQYALLLAPDAPSLYNANGNLNWSPNIAGKSTFINPLASVIGANFNNTTKNTVNSLSLNYRVLRGLEVRASAGYTNTLSSLYLPFRLDKYAPERRINFSRSTTNVERDMNSWIFEPQIQYVHTIAKGKMDVLAGGTILQNRAKYLSVTGSGYSNDLLMQTVGAATTVSASSVSTQSKFNGLFGRVNYIWDSKYVMNLTGRRDGSSKFGDANKLHNFGSVGLAWIFTQESWINKTLNFLSFGKLRASYGSTGNDQIGDFGNLSLYSVINGQILYQGGIGLQPTKIPNPHLQWEETRKLQGGIDLGFINDRIMVGSTYARNRSTNQLVSYTIPSTTGFTTVAENMPALIQNTSWEFVLNTTNIKTKDFFWTTGGNLTIPRNKVLSFPGIEKTSYADGTSGVIVGEGLGVKKLYKYAGVDVQTGKYQFFNSQGQLTYNPNYLTDENELLSNFVKFYGGVQNSFNYKGIELDISFQFVRQLGPRDMNYNNTNSSNPPGSFTGDGLSNNPLSVSDHWQKSGENAIVGKYSTTEFDATIILYPLFQSTGFYNYNASFVRLKNVSLSWQFPENLSRQLKIQNARIYLQGQNLATMTNYRGLDPETLSSLVLPPLRTITFGLQIGL
jgi:TonB-linked SusC/RagA family outer membrane protein